MTYQACVRPILRSPRCVAMSIDLFNDALKSCDDDSDSDATLTMGEAPSASGVVDRMDNGGTPTAVTPANKGKRPLTMTGAQPRGRKVAKRDNDDDKLLRLTKIEQSDGADVKCIFLQRKTNKRKQDKQDAIPLLPQYKAAWGTADFGTHRWLVISPQEEWVQIMMRLCLYKKRRTEADSRSACTHFYVMVKNEFDDALNKFRAHAVLAAKNDDEETPGPDDQGDDSQATAEDNATEIAEVRFRIGKGVTTVAALKIGGCHVECLNTRKRVVLKIDEAVVPFLTDWLRPLFYEAARLVVVHNCAKKAKFFGEPRSELNRASGTPSRPKAWAFSHDKTPDVKDKLTWVPAKSAWRVKAQVGKNKGVVPATNLFYVDEDLRGHAYNVEKARKYIEAMNEWNDKDKSKRAKIEASCFLRDFAADIRQQSTKPIAGSQSSPADGSQSSPHDCHADGAQPSLACQRMFGENA